MSDFIFVLGFAVLSIALRSFAHPLIHKLGTFCILGTSFLVGYLFTGYWEVGALCAASWLLLPWLEILTRVRQIRLPLQKALRHRSPPSQDVFPSLDSLTEDLEDEGFEQVEDTGWDWEDHQQFFRLFYKADECLQASICLINQDDIAFYYLSFSSRGKDGTTWNTWNYPFSYAMKMVPQFQMNRLRGERTVLEMIASHREFLTKGAVGPERLAPSLPEEIQAKLQKDMELQIAHNVSVGLLLPADEKTVRYSWRGMFFIWFEFLRDFVRLS
ncbi:MAG: hypothetical protein WCP06_00710 [Verrucomicrobiota bacterium]